MHHLCPPSPPRSDRLPADARWTLPELLAMCHDFSRRDVEGLVAGLDTLVGGCRDDKIYLLSG